MKNLPSFDKFVNEEYNLVNEKTIQISTEFDDISLGMSDALNKAEKELNKIKYVEKIELKRGDFARDATLHVTVAMKKYTKEEINDENRSSLKGNMIESVVKSLRNIFDININDAKDTSNYDDEKFTIFISFPVDYKTKTVVYLKNEKQTNENVNNVNESVGDRIVDSKEMHKLGISSEDIKFVVNIADEVAKKVGDKGSCVLGGGLMANNKRIICAYSQGSLGPEEIYQKAQEYLKSKYPKIEFYIEWGNMD